MGSRKSFTRHEGERETFTLTDDEWRSVGGEPPPEGYDPDAAQTVGTRAHSSEGPTMTAGDWQYRTTVNPTRPKRALPLSDYWEEWLTIAKAHDVHLLTIRWPDPYSPEFTAVAK